MKDLAEVYRDKSPSLGSKNTPILRGFTLVNIPAQDRYLAGRYGEE